MANVFATNLLFLSILLFFNLHFTDLLIHLPVINRINKTQNLEFLSKKKSNKLLKTHTFLKSRNDSLLNSSQSLHAGRLNNIDSVTWQKYNDVNTTHKKSIFQSVVDNKNSDKKTTNASKTSEHQSLVTTNHQTSHLSQELNGSTLKYLKLPSKKLFSSSSNVKLNYTELIKEKPILHETENENYIKEVNVNTFLNPSIPKLSELNNVTLQTIQVNKLPENDDHKVSHRAKSVDQIATKLENHKHINSKKSYYTDEYANISETLQADVQENDYFALTKNVKIKHRVRRNNNESFSETSGGPVSVSDSLNEHNKDFSDVQLQEKTDRNENFRSSSGSMQKNESVSQFNISTTQLLDSSMFHKFNLKHKDSVVAFTCVFVLVFLVFGTVGVSRMWKKKNLIWDNYPSKEEIQTIQPKFKIKDLLASKTKYLLPRFKKKRKAHKNYTYVPLKNIPSDESSDDLYSVLQQ